MPLSQCSSDICKKNNRKGKIMQLNSFSKFVDSVEVRV